MSRHRRPAQVSGVDETMTPCPALLFSDVDGTLLDSHTSPATIAAGWAALAGRVEMVLVSSRTVEELLELLGEWDATADLIAENGACIAVRSRALARDLGARETVTRRGQHWYVASRAAPMEAVLATARRLRDRYGADVILAPELPRHRQLHLLGGDQHRAQLALTRRSSVLAVHPSRSDANDAWLRALQADGLHAAVGGRWLTIWHGLDKGAAAGAYLAARRYAGYRPTCTAAIGDAENDVSLLRAVPTRFVVRQSTGAHDPSLMAVPAAIPLAHAGHAGWREAVVHLLCPAIVDSPDA